MSQTADDEVIDEKGEVRSSDESKELKAKTDQVEELESASEFLEDQFEETLQGWVLSGTSWGSAWLKTAKEKTFTTFEAVKKDLTEFSDVVASEASALASTTVESVKHQAQNLHQMIDDDGTSLTAHTPTETEAETSSSETFSWRPKFPSIPTITSNSWVKSLVDTVKNIALENSTEGEEEFTETIKPHLQTRKSELPHHVLYGMQTSRKTYLSKPEGDEELYKVWCDRFNIVEYDGEISALLANCPPMRALYQEIVPSTVENITFWQRYFYKVHQAELMAHCKVEAEMELSSSPDPVKSVSDSDEKSSNKTDELTVDASGRSNHRSPDRRSNTDESWSVCSSSNIDLQEIHEDGAEEPLTPKADNTNSFEKSNDGWVNWDE